LVPLRYWAFRMLRRAFPQTLVDWMLDRGVYLKAGADTTAPSETSRDYLESARRHGIDVRGATALIFGFGGGFGVALYLLEAGVGHVILQDPFAPYRPAHNARLPADRMACHFDRVGNRWKPRADSVSVVDRYLADFARGREGSVDLVVSSSVLEHVSAAEDEVAACARLTRPGGLNVHRIDLRDHFFDFPFEMLCYSEQTWRRWLNSSNNLNRWRLPRYEEVFRRHFAAVTVHTLVSLADEFAATRERIREEFLSGDDSVDCTAVVKVEAVR
jgi:SAM-dependent methyltransferase